MNFKNRLKPAAESVTTWYSVVIMIVIHYYHAFVGGMVVIVVVAAVVVAVVVCPGFWIVDEERRGEKVEFGVWVFRISDVELGVVGGWSSVVAFLLFLPCFARFFPSAPPHSTLKA